MPVMNYLALPTNFVMQVCQDFLYSESRWEIHSLLSLHSPGVSLGFAQHWENHQQSFQIQITIGRVLFSSGYKERGGGCNCQVWLNIWLMRNLKANSGVVDDEEVHVVEVWQSFKTNASVFKSYFMKTLFELIFGLILFFWMSLLGVRQFINWNTWNVEDISVNDLVDLREDNIRVFCEVHDSWYECAGNL